MSKLVLITFIIIIAIIIFSSTMVGLKYTQTIQKFEEFEEKRSHNFDTTKYSDNLKNGDRLNE